MFRLRYLAFACRHTQPPWASDDLPKEDTIVESSRSRTFASATLPYGALKLDRRRRIAARSCELSVFISALERAIAADKSSSHPFVPFAPSVRSIRDYIY